MTAPTYPEELLKFKTREALDHARCACCGKRPESLDPLPKGWGWDTAERDNPYLWCPEYQWG